MTRTLAVLGAAVLLSAALAGCGSDKADGSGEKSSDAKTLTKAEFQTKTNQLCKDLNKDMETLGADLSADSSDAQVKEIITKLVARNEKLADDIDALEVPADLQADVDSMLTSLRAAGAEMSKVGSVADINALDLDHGVFAASDQKAKALGLTECAD